MRFIELNKLKIGDKLAVDVYDNDQTLLLAKGKLLTVSLINKLNSLGFTGVYIDDNVSKGVNFVSAIPIELCNSTITDLQSLDIDKAFLNAKKIVNVLMEMSDTCPEFFNIKTFDNYTYQHSLSVAIYSTLLGIASGYKDEELVNLAVAGLLHDIGKLMIDAEIINKPDKLTNTEYSIIKQHSKHGYDMVRKNFDISSTIKMGIYEHHENEDGSGYPRGLKGDKIYKFAKIIHICDVYDALISKRQYKESQTPYEAIKFILDKKGKMFDADFVKLFIEVIPAFPVGTMVMLNNGTVGIVKQNTIGYCFRPVIKTETEEIDLKKEVYKKLFVKFFDISDEDIERCKSIISDEIKCGIVN